MQGIDYQWEADLADVQNLSEHNNDIKFLLMIVAVFSRFLWVRPLKDRKAKLVIDEQRRVNGAETSSNHQNRLGVRVLQPIFTTVTQRPRNYYFMP